MGQTLLLKNGYMADPDTGYEGYADLLIRDGLIEEAGPDLSAHGAAVYDLTGMTVLPGLVDLHVHLRDPGQTHKEDLVTASEAAARGGVTTLLAMPNTTPPMDRPERIRYVTEKAAKVTRIHILQASAITKDMAGEELTDIEALAASGVKAFSEDGKSVMNASLMRKAMRRIAGEDLLICDHCEEITMVEGGVMNDDANARRLDLPGIGNEVEDVIAARDVILAKHTGARLHLCHCSTAGSVRILEQAKEQHLPVSGEVCPHHFILSSDDIPCDDGNFKMNPPLRSKEDVLALREGLKNGVIDCISTDHAPHSADEKSRGFRKSPFGIVGIETSAALTYTELVRPGVITLMQMAEKMSFNPAKILRVPGGSLRPGMPADVAVFDFEKVYTIDPGTFASKGKNTPFAGRTVFGETVMTIAGGEIVYERGKR